MSSLPGCLLYRIARGLIGPGDLVTFSNTTWDTIVQDPSLYCFIPKEMSTVVEEAMMYLIDQGGYPLRAFWLMTAVLIPQIWHAENVSDPDIPYPVLRRQVDAFIFVKRGFETPERYIFAVQRLMDAQMVNPIPQPIKILNAPRTRLRVAKRLPELDPIIEKRLKTDHHTQLHLREGNSGTFQEQMAITERVTEMIKHRDYIQAVLCVLFRCYLFSHNESARDFPVR